MKGSTSVAYIKAVTVNSSGLFVAVGYDSSIKPVYAKSSNGSTWTTPANMIIGGSDTMFTQSIAVNNSGVFSAVGYDNSASNFPVCAKSTDGINWSVTIMGVFGSLSTCYIGSITVNSSGLFVAVGRKTNGPAYSTSADGYNWSIPALMNGSTVSANMTSVTVNTAGTFVAVGTESSNYPVYAISIN